MPKTIEIPGIGPVDFPDSMTDEQIVGAIRKMPKTQGINPSMSNNMGSANVVSSALTGGLDVAGGLAGLASRSAEALGMPKGTNNAFIASPDIVAKSTKEAKEAVAQRFGEPNSALTRGVAGGALTIPFTPIRAAMTAPTLLGRAGWSGVGGGIAGAAQDVPDAENTGDYWKKKLAQGGAGTVTGFLASPVAEGAIGAATKVANFFGNKAATVARGAIGTDELVQLTRASLQKNGIDYDSLAENVKQALLGDVDKALKANPGVNAGAVARQAAFRQEGFNPLQHWITKDPEQWTTNQNLAGIEGVGGALQQRKSQFDEFLINRLNQMRGGAKTDASEVGTLAARDLNAWLKGEKAKTNVLYNTVRDIAPNDIPGDPQRFANRLFGSLEGQAMMGALPKQFHGFANQISSGELPLNARTIDELIKAANAAHGSDKAANNALRFFKNALGDELTVISEAAIPRGGDARFTANALELARGQNSKVRGAVDSVPALKAIEDGTFAPEQFFGTYIANGNVSLKELAATWGKLSTDARDAIRQKMIDQLKAVAFGGASDESGKAAAQASFNKMLTKDGMDKKLEIILGKPQAEQVKRLGLMMESASLIPSGAAPNTSNTAAAVVSHLMKMGEGYKNLGLPMSKAVSNVGARGQASMALANDPTQLGARSVIISPEWEEILKRFGGGLLGPGVGAGTGGLLSGN